MNEDVRMTLTEHIAALIFDYDYPEDEHWPSEETSMTIARQIMGILDDYLPTKAGALEIKYSDEEVATDYVLREQACWVEVGDIAIRIKHAGIGVDIELHPNYPSEGDGSPVAELSYDFDDLPENIEEEE